MSATGHAACMQGVSPATRTCRWSQKPRRGARSARIRGAASSMPPWRPPGRPLVSPPPAPRRRPASARRRRAQTPPPAPRGWAPLRAGRGGAAAQRSVSVRAWLGGGCARTLPPHWRVAVMRQLPGAQAPRRQAKWTGGAHPPASGAAASGGSAAAGPAAVHQRGLRGPALVECMHARMQGRRRAWRETGSHHGCCQEAARLARPIGSPCRTG